MVHFGASAEKSIFITLFDHCPAWPPIATPHQLVASAAKPFQVSMSCHCPPTMVGVVLPPASGKPFNVAVFAIGWNLSFCVITFRQLGSVASVTVGAPAGAAGGAAAADISSLGTPI